MSRRAIVALALGTKGNEAIVFRLFGLDPQAYRVPNTSRQSAALIFFPAKPAIPELLRTYQQKLARFFMEYHYGHAQDSIAPIQEWLRQFPSLLTLTCTVAEKLHLLALQSRIHRLLACIACERWETEQMLFHTKRAVALAEHAMTLPEISGNRDLLMTGNELLASALCTRAIAYHEFGESDSAHKISARALSMVSSLKSGQLKIEILLSAALIHAVAPTPATNQQTILSYLDQAEQLSAQISEINVPDENGILSDKGMVALYRAWCFSSPHGEGCSSEKILTLLDDAVRWTDASLIRRHAEIAYLQASIHFSAGSYLQVVERARDALEKSIQIRSHFWRNTIEGLYQQLLSTSSRENPFVVYLGVRLCTWDYGRDGESLFGEGI